MAKIKSLFPPVKPKGIKRFTKLQQRLAHRKIKYKGDYSSNPNQQAIIIPGDCQAVLAKFPSKSINCLVTSPPYFNLRNYQVEGQIGLEETPDEYIAKLVSVFREVKRVLRNDGILWINLGDSYVAGGYSKPHTGLAKAAQASDGRVRHTSGPRAQFDKVGGRTVGVKPKNLLMIPARVAIALQADGWILRSEIIWEKSNALPESMRDRPTNAHEKIFLFAKSHKPTIWQARDTLEWSNKPDLSETILNNVGEEKPRWRGQSYYYDADAVREPNSEWSLKALEGRWIRKTRNACPDRRDGAGNDGAGANCAAKVNPAGRNLRNVWTIPPKPFKGAHFAVFPPALIKPCIKAGCPAGGIVLDPFGGSGTTALVANKFGRNAVLIELNPEYAKMARRRIYKT